MLADTIKLSADKTGKFVNEINRGKHKITSNKQKISSYRLKKILREYFFCLNLLNTYLFYEVENSFGSFFIPLIKFQANRKINFGKTKYTLYKYTFE